MIAENGMALCLDRSTVESASISKNAFPHMPGTEEAPTFAITFKLKDVAADAFRRLTEENVGSRLGFWFDGHLLYEPRLVQALSGRTAWLVIETESDALAVAAEAEAYRCSSNEKA